MSVLVRVPAVGAGGGTLSLHPHHPPTRHCSPARTNQLIVLNLLAPNLISSFQNQLLEEVIEEIWEKSRLNKPWAHYNFIRGLYPLWDQLKQEGTMILNWDLELSVQIILSFHSLIDIYRIGIRYLQTSYMHLV